MKIKTEIEMDMYDVLDMFYNHYVEEKRFAKEYINMHTYDGGYWSSELVDTIHYGMDSSIYGFRVMFEKFAEEKMSANADNMVAFVSTLKYFGMKNIEILS